MPLRLVVMAWGKNATGEERGRFRPRGTRACRFARARLARRRSAVAKALRHTAPTQFSARTTGEYWQEYRRRFGSGSRAFVAYMQFRVPVSALRLLASRYARVTKSDGLRVVTVFPGFGWMRDTPTQGALPPGDGRAMPRISCFGISILSSGESRLLHLTDLRGHLPGPRSSGCSKCPLAH